MVTLGIIQVRQIVEKKNKSILKKDFKWLVNLATLETNCLIVIQHNKLQNGKTK